MRLLAGRPELLLISKVGVPSGLPLLPLLLLLLVLRVLLLNGRLSLLQLLTS